MIISKNLFYKMNLKIKLKIKKFKEKDKIIKILFINLKINRKIYNQNKKSLIKISEEVSIVLRIKIN